MDEELREPFEDYYESVKSEIDRRSAEWGFNCGNIHGEATQEARVRELFSLLKEVDETVKGCCNCLSCSELQTRVDEALQSLKG